MTKIKKIQCPNCDKGFSTRSNLRRHQNEYCKGKNNTDVVQDAPSDMVSHAIKDAVTNVMANMTTAMATAMATAMVGANGGGDESGGEVSGEEVGGTPIQKVGNSNSNSNSNEIGGTPVQKASNSNSNEIGGTLATFPAPNMSPCADIMLSLSAQDQRFPDFGNNDGERGFLGGGPSLNQDDTSKSDEDADPMMDFFRTAFKNLESKLETKIDSALGPPGQAIVPYDKEGKGEKGKDEDDPKIDIVCLAKGDYVKKLIQLHDGDEAKAMKYIMNVGIATDFLEGDFRMIKKIYFDGKLKSQFPIRVKDFKRNKLEFLEENGQWVLDIRGEIVAKRLCDNLVATLLVANTQFNQVIIDECDEDRKELLLDLFKINKTQAHIMKLLERKTQGKLCRRVTEFINYCTEVQAETGSLENVKKAYD